MRDRYPVPVSLGPVEPITNAQCHRLLAEEPDGERRGAVRLQPFRGERFVTLFGSPAEPERRINGPVDTAALQAAQDRSLADLRVARRAYKRSVRGVIDRFFG